MPVNGRYKLKTEVGRGDALGGLTLSAAIFGMLLVGGSLQAEPMAVQGITEPFLDVTLSSPVAGMIHAEPFKEGDAVKKGDVLLEMDKQLEELEVTRRKEVMVRAKTSMESTGVLFQTSKAVSKDELLKQTVEYNVAAADYQIASEQLARRRIVAPFPGSITQVFQHIGAGFEPRQPLVRVVDTTRFYFVGSLDGRIVSKLTLRQPVTVEVAGVPAPLSGTICFISPVVDAASGLAVVKAIFDNGEGRVRPGLQATLKAEPSAP